MGLIQLDSNALKQQLCEASKTSFDAGLESGLNAVRGVLGIAKANGVVISYEMVFAVIDDMGRAIVATNALGTLAGEGGTPAIKQEKESK